MLEKVCTLVFHYEMAPVFQLADEVRVEATFGRLNPERESAIRDVTHPAFDFVKLVNELGLTASAGEAKRMIKQGAVKIDDVKVMDAFGTVNVDKTMILKVGKRKLAKVIPE